MREAIDHRLNPITNFVIVAGGAAAARAFVNPFSVAKIMAEVGVPGGKIGVSSTLMWIFREHGILGFFRGLPAAVARAAPYTAIQFVAYDRILRLFPKRPIAKFKGQLPALSSFMDVAISGGFAGVIATAFTHPLDVAKTRMSIQSVDPLKAWYKNLPEALTTIYKRESLYSGLYRGFIPSALGSAVFSSSFFLLWDVTDNMPWRRREARRLIYQEWFVLPVIAITAACFVSHPIDVIRKKIMAQSSVLPNNGLCDVRSKGILDCIVKHHKINGYPGFFQGLIPNAMKVCDRSQRCALFNFTAFCSGCSSACCILVVYCIGEVCTCRQQLIEAGVVSLEAAQQSTLTAIHTTDVQLQLANCCNILHRKVSE